ncbi:MAG: C40 family peptidase [Muribaculaceae bacterium]|nr:C40 family peptidase [Muribaculaceae bacterium]
MNFFKTLTAIVISAAAILPVSAQTTASQKAHQRAHASQLANVKSSKLDKTVINNMLKEDVSKRENDAVKGLSSESERMIADLLTEASKHIGKPYRHGMKGPNAFDCSGFTSYVYKQFGYKISPASRIQYTDGVQVDRKELRKGDLVFFTSRSSGKNVGHVGIVTEANNATGDFKFIHASIRGVRINSCEGYYEGRYVGARRVITE